MFRNFAQQAQRRGNQLFSEAMIGEPLSVEDFATAEDPGLFGPTSVTWQVHSDMSMLVGGFRSLVLQSLHPLAMAAVADHSVVRADPLGRFRRTVRFVSITSMGNTAAAERLIQRVNKIHSGIKGTTPDGSAYRANDPHLILWVHVAEVESFLDAYERFGQQRLSPQQSDDYVGEMAQIAIRLGAIEGQVPTTVSQLRQSLDRFRSECEYGNQAREGVEFLLKAPMSPIARGPYAAIGAAALFSLPSWAQAMMSIAPKPGVGPLLVEPSADVLLNGLRWLARNPAREHELQEIFGDDYQTAG